MARQRGNTFSFLKGASKPDKFGVLPIKAEFGGSLPSSIYRVNSASSWSRWRRGFELATASYYQNTITMADTKRRKQRRQCWQQQQQPMVIMHPWSFAH